MTIGDLIKQYRKEHHLSQRKFAYLCGISNGYVAMIENNRNPNTGEPPVLGINIVRAIANALGMTTDELVRITDGNTVVSLSVTDEPAPNKPELNTQEGLEPIRKVTAESPYAKVEIVPVVSSEPWKTDVLKYEEDETIRIMAMGMHRLTPENRRKLLDVAKVMFPDAFH